MAMNRRTPVIVLSLAAVVIALSWWGVYSSEGSQKAREREARLSDARASTQPSVGASLLVEALMVRKQAATEVVELSGVLEAVRRTWVAAEIAGRILEVPAAEHSPVAAGDVLVRLDAALPRAELVRAEANHRLASSELERQKRLGSRSVASEAELDRAAAEERSSYAAVLEARTRVGHTKIVAPFDGVVNALELDPGAYVQPGTPIAEILDVSTIEVTVPVSDRQVGALHPGGEARVRIDPIGNAIIAGRIVRVGRAPQAATQRYPLVIALPNADGKLLPGMLAYVRIEVGETESLRVPKRAVLREFELDYVFTLESSADGSGIVARRRRVDTRPVPFRPDWVEILSGVEDGARVAVSALSQLREGAAVRVEAEAPGPAT